MFNEEMVYYQSGLIAGKASRNQDASLAKFEREWFAKARAYERSEDKVVADAAYKRGYTEGRGRIGS